MASSGGDTAISVCVNVEYRLLKVGFLLELIEILSNVWYDDVLRDSKQDLINAEPRREV